MSFLVVDPQVGGKSQESGKGKVFARGGTALSRALDEAQEAWLLEHVAGRWQALHGALMDWRNRLGRFERLADENYSDRTVPNREKSDAPRSIFERQNHTLGLVSGKCDQVYAQAKDDLFGTRPWLSATPQGAEDTELADRRLLSSIHTAPAPGHPSPSPQARHSRKALRRMPRIGCGPMPWAADFRAGMH